MDYKESLEKLEKLLDGYKKHYIDNPRDASVSLEYLCTLYGELEELINRFAGIQKITVGLGFNVEATYPNYVESALFSGWAHHVHQGYTQLLKIVGKVRQHAKDPAIPKIEYSITNLIEVLRRFRECCQYLTIPLQDESYVQSVLWTILRSHFERLEKEETLPKFGAKSYRPDFGIPDLRVLIEAKFIGPKTDVATIQDGILSDVAGYLKSTPDYDSIVIFVYDSAQKMRDSRKFTEDIKTVEGIIDVIVVPGIGQ